MRNIIIKDRDATDPYGYIEFTGPKNDKETILITSRADIIVNEKDLLKISRWCDSRLAELRKLKK